jgi:general L-amino acid transport system substrate-binding protein
MSRWSRAVAVAAALALGLAACNGDDADDPIDDPAAVDDDDLVIDDDEDPAAEPADTGDSLLDTVRERGEVVCGVNDAVAGFGLVTEDGEYEGFDIDFCHAVAAAVIGDADAVQFVPLTAEQRFTALQAGEIDVLIRNTTWTATRDGGEGAAFATTTFYDGQGMMVRADAGFGSIDDLDDTEICVLSGTTTELNLETYFLARDLNYQGLTFDDNDAIREAFLEDRCDGWTSDLSQLSAHRSTWPDDEGGPDALIIFDDVMSKEPLGPAVQDGDSRWFDAVNWTVLATIIAEEMGVDSTNIDQLLDETDPETEPGLGKFLGLTDEDPGLGLDTDFAVNVIRQVGNYAEIYERNVGPDTPLGLERGVNALWTDGGLLYAPPY